MALFLKKLILALTIITTPFIYANVSTAPLASLQSAYDQFNFALEVEWDQEDKEFYAAALEQFEATVEELTEQGMTNQDFIQFLQNNIQDRNIAKNIDQLFSTVNAEEMEASEVRDYVIDFVASNSTSGAHWTGRSHVADAFLITALVSIIVIAILVTPTSSSGGYTSYCYDELVCDYWGCYWVTYCY